MALTMLLGLFGGGVGLGVVVAVLGLRSSSPEPDEAEPAEPRPLTPRLRPIHLVALLVGILALVVTRWPMAVPLGAAGVLGMEGLGSGKARSSIGKLEAIAVWAEMLRDTLAGASGLAQALIATAATAPLELKHEIAAMANELSGGVPVEHALRDLADAIDDPAGDMVAAALLMASRERAQKLGDLLGALARSVRDEVTMRLRIEASRASSRTAVRMITGFSLALFVLMALFARSYLAPYSRPLGQAVLALVGVLFGLGLWLMASMVRPKLLPRLGLSKESS